VTTTEAIKLLEQFRAGHVGRDKVLHAFQAAPVANLGFAQVDTHRALRRGFPEDGRQTRSSRLSAVLYGSGSALTLDEFALWLNLQDVYWQGAGRESIDAVVIFAALLSVGIWGGPFFSAVAGHLWRSARPA